MGQKINTIFTGLFLIALGVVFFANMYGILPWNFWINVVDLWPLVLIIAGIALFFNKRVPFSAVLLIFLVVLVGYSIIFGHNFNRHAQITPDSHREMNLEAVLEERVEKANLDLSLGGTALKLSALDDLEESSYLVQGNYQWNPRFGKESRFLSRHLHPEPEFKYDRSGRTAKVKFNTKLGSGSSGDTLDLQLSPQVEYDIDLSAGAIDGTLDFSQLRIEDLDISVGASALTLIMGDNGGRAKVDLSSGASDITIIVPESVGLKINVSGIVSETNFAGDGMLLSSKDWVSDNYNEAKTKIEMDISMAAGKIDLQRTKDS
ncbi:MAG: cell wall-active antibiotics response protein [Desulfitobacterium sp.]|nr:cell wall-active antibiotics response protein [Desulfitobacterium sp.]